MIGEKCTAWNYLTSIIEQQREIIIYIDNMDYISSREYTYMFHGTIFLFYPEDFIFSWIEWGIKFEWKYLKRIYFFMDDNYLWLKEYIYGLINIHFTHHWWNG